MLGRQQWVLHQNLQQQNPLRWRYLPTEVRNAIFSLHFIFWKFMHRLPLLNWLVQVTNFLTFFLQIEREVRDLFRDYVQREYFLLPSMCWSCGLVTWIYFLTRCIFSPFFVLILLTRLIWALEILSSLSWYKPKTTCFMPNQSLQVTSLCNCLIHLPVYVEVYFTWWFNDLMLCLQLVESSKNLDNKVGKHPIRKSSKILRPVICHSPFPLLFIESIIFSYGFHI